MVRHLVRATILVSMSLTPVWAEGGADLFKSKCAACHGETGKSDTKPGKKMDIKPIAGDAAIAAMSDDELTKKILGAEKHPKGVKGLSAADAASVAAVVKQLAGTK